MKTTFKKNIFVIIVTYNGAHWINSCLSSLRDSTLAVKTIVIDNNSTDHTRDIIKSNFPEVLLVESGENLGFGKANNVGIKMAEEREADYFFLLNQDAWIQPDTLEVLIGINLKHPEYFILSPMHLDGPGLNLDYTFSIHISPNICKNLVSDVMVRAKPTQEVYPATFVNAAFWLISKRCISEIGYFDPIFPHYGEDNDYVNRVTYHNKKIGISPDVYGFHDRDQTPVDLDSFKHSKRFNRQKIVSLIILMNINNSFSKCMMLLTKNRTEFLLNTLFKLQFRSFFTEIKVTFSALTYLPQVLRNRKINKKNFSNTI